MIESDISTALCNAVQAAVTAAAPTVPIAWPGRTFDTSANEYLEVVQIRTNFNNETWGEERTYQGFLRIIYNVLAADKGVVPYSTIVDAIASAAALKKGSLLFSGAAKVLLYDNPDMGSVIFNDGRMLFPLTVKYRDFHTG